MMRRHSLIPLVLLAGCTVGPHDLTNPVPTPPAKQSKLTAFFQ